MNRILKIIACMALMILICGCAFAASTLELPASLTVVREEAFAGDTSIETVIVPEGVTAIESKAFADSGLSLIQLPSTLKSIAPDAFEGVAGFKAVAAEGTWAYTYCTENNIPIQDWVQETPASHFEWIILENEGENLVHIRGAKTQLKDVVIPEKIEGNIVFSISEGYFEENTALETLYVPDGVNQISAYNVPNLINVSYPSTADFPYFTGCSSLKSVVVRRGDMNNDWTKVAANAFKNCTSLKSIIIADDVTEIHSNAFQNCTSLTEIKLPKSLEYIYDGAFDGCTNLQKIEGVYSENWIYSNTFRNCKKLESLVLLDNVQDIYATAFEGCENLTLTVMPGSETIAKCDELGLKYTVAEYGYGKIYDKAELEFTGYAGTNPKLIIPSEAYDMPVTAVGYEALENNENITSVTIPDSVKTIGSRAFYSCSNLSKVKLPAGLTKIESWTFDDCDSLAHIDIPDTVTEIGRDAFYDCDELTEVTIPASVKVIGDYAFSAYDNYGRKFAILNKTADITFGSGAISSYYDLTVYCYKYSGADAWAQGQGFNIVYLDDNDFASVGSVSLPASMRIAAGKTDWVPLSVFPDLGDLDVTCITKNGDVATVSNGLVTAKSKGEVEIMVMVGNKTASMPLTVYLELTAFDLSDTEITIEAGATYQLSCVNIAPEGADAVFSYESSNTLAASVDANGLITASAIGDATITVTSDSGIEQTCIVHVVRPAT